MTLIAAFLLCGKAAIAGEPFVERGFTFEAGGDGYHTFRLPTLVVSSSGTLLLFCDGRKRHAGDIGKIDVVLRRSLDGGKTWEPLQLLHTDAGEKAKVGNACPVLDRQTGAVHLLFCKNLTQALLITSTDDGATFGEPVDITYAFKQFDHPWKYFATGHVHGIQMKSGRLVLPVWCNDMPRSAETKGKMRPGVIYSDDHGKTFHAGGLLPHFHSLNESTVFETGDGGLCLNSRALRLGCRVVSRSSDGGKTWTPPQMDEQLPCPTCQASTLRLPSGDGKSRVLFSNPGIGKGRSGMTVRLSYDDGRTWPVSKLIDKGAAGYSDMAVAPDGTIYLVYEAGRKRSSDRIAVVRFNLEWLTGGKGRLVR